MASSTPRTRLAPLGLTLPAALFAAAFLLVPAGYLVLVSFWRTAYFETTADWNLDQYRTLLDQDAVIRTLVRSVLTGLATACVTVLVAYPVALFLRFRAGRWRTPLLAVIVTALFSSYIVRIYAWRSLMGREGAINWVLQESGITDEPTLLFFYNRFAVVLTLTHIFLPFAIVQLAVALESVDADILEASRTLGARGLQTLRWVTLPIIGPGLFAAFAFTLILSAADYVTPQLVGGTSGSMVGTLIVVQFLQNGDYSSGAALSLLLLLSLVAVCAVVYAAGRVLGKAWR